MNWVQLHAMLWLRWRLTWNQWRRGGQVSAVITVIATLVGAALALLGAVGGLAGGFFGLSQASPLVTMLVWDGLVVAFLFFWGSGFVSELQRSEIIDLGRLMHLPVSLRDVFFLNYVASHFSFSLAALLPAALGLAAGTLLKRGPAMLLLFPLVIGFFFMVTAWTYCLRGWLAAVMINKRRRRAIIVGITMAFVLLVQLPNLLFNVVGSHYIHPPEGGGVEVSRRFFTEDGLVAGLGVMHRFVPPLWLPEGARTLAEGRAWPAMLCAFGMIAVGTWGLARAYRGTLRLYQGAETKKPARRPAVEPRDAAGRRLLVERSLPGVPEQAAALALAGLRSLARAPEVKMGLGINVVMFAVIGAGILLQRAGALPEAARPFAAAGAVAMTFMGLSQLMFNQFGFDRAGFRTLVLAPAPRHLVLLGKNLSLLPIVLVALVLYLSLTTVLAHLAPLDVLSAVLEAGGAFLLLSVLGNFISITAPYRVPAGSLKPARAKGMAQLLTITTRIFLPLAFLPLFVPALMGLLSGHLGLAPRGLVTLACAFLMAAGCGLLYWQTLQPLGGLLQRREQRILEVVTQEVE